jgi:hypothetical protein
LFFGLSSPSLPFEVLAPPFPLDDRGTFRSDLGERRRKREKNIKKAIKKPIWLWKQKGKK